MQILIKDGLIYLVFSGENNFSPPQNTARKVILVGGICIIPTQQSFKEKSLKIQRVICSILFGGSIFLIMVFLDLIIKTIKSSSKFRIL